MTTEPETGRRDSPAGPGKPPLRGLRVLDCASLFAGPVIAAILGDFGADVIKIEHPSGDAIRKVGQTKDGVPLWWKVVARNNLSKVMTIFSTEPETMLVGGTTMWSLVCNETI